MAMNPLNPKKLLLTKWTAVKPVAKQKHFLVSRVIQSDDPTDPIQRVEIEAVFPRLCRRLPGVICRTSACGGRVRFDHKLAMIGGTPASIASCLEKII